MTQAAGKGEVWSVSRDNLDELLKDVCTNEYEKIEGLKDIAVPDIKRTMAKFRDNIGPSSKSRRNIIPGVFLFAGFTGSFPYDRIRKKQIRIVYTSVCVMLCAGLLFIAWNTPQVQALKLRIVNTRFFVKDNITTILQSDTDYSALLSGKIPPPPPYDFDEEPPSAEPSRSDSIPGAPQSKEMEEVKPLLMTLEQAVNEVPYPLLLPGYMPDGYTLREVEVSPLSKTFYIIEQRYKNNGGKQISIKQQSGILNFASSSSTKLEVSTIEIMGTEAIMITNRLDYCNVYWHKNESHYEVSGNIPDSEMLKILDDLYLGNEPVN
jgi:hypothetical protein